ncbi:Uncharacterised protein [Bordetella pertussis]|nr:Uncharacterised protein [Bordetella pertussis]
MSHSDTSRHQTANTMATVGVLFRKTYTTMGTISRNRGSCTMQISSATMAHSPAAGTPASRKPRPASTAWIRATPITPWATARMVAAVSCASATPCSGPAMRTPIACAARLAGSA